MSANKDFVGSKLTEYRSKRKPRETPEPFGDSGMMRSGTFVVQQHAARRLHFDLRLELGGVLLSWAIPKGFSFDTQEKTLAIRTEDHPLEYVDFEGIIPEGNYGAGAMIIWDRGKWVPLEDPETGIENGKLLFELQGYKLKGIWTLFVTKKSDKEWLLMKKPDGWADENRAKTLRDESVLSGLTVTELEQAHLKGDGIKASLVEMECETRDVDLNEIQPMLAEATEKAFTKKGWLFELKYDGFRVLAARRGDRVNLRYRSGRDATRYFPDIARSLIALPFDSFTLDGEVVVLNEYGKPDFQLLQARGRQPLSLRSRDLSIQNPVTFFCFDLLSFGTFDTRSLPLTKRKELLERMLPPVGPIQCVSHYEERGVEVFEQVSKLGFEGVVAKNTRSSYTSGRSKNWLKIHAGSSSNFLIAGYTLPRGSRTGFGALHLAAYKGDSLVYVGRVGTGFSHQLLVDLRTRLDLIKIPSPAFSGPIPEGADHIWAEPHIVCHVAYKEITRDGLLRQPSFHEVRDEVIPTECFLPASQEPISPAEGEIDRSEKNIPFTNLDKIFWPGEHLTKGDLVEYYRQISDWLLPYLTDRLVVLDRYPDGIDGKSFFQKNAPDFIPSWIRTEQLWSEEFTEGNNFFVCNDLETLLYIANLAAIPLHVWGSRISSLQKPDWCVLDLDPTEVSFLEVVNVAREIRSLCDSCGIEPLIKTSGSKGLHILIPLGKSLDFIQARMVAELIARVVAYRLPEIASVERAPQERQGKVYLDYLQNGYGKLLVAPYSVRPLAGATVSTPLGWDEVNENLDPNAFNIRTVPARMKQVGSDPLKPVLQGDFDFASALARLDEEIRASMD